MNTSQHPKPARKIRLDSTEDLDAVACIAQRIVGAFNESARSVPGQDDLLHYIDAMVGRRQGAGMDSPPHVVIWLDLKKAELDDAELALALAARHMLDGRITAAFDCTVDVYWRHTGEFTPMLGGGPA